MIFPNFSNGIKRIWEEDEVSQSHYLSIIGEETRNLPLEIFQRFNAFFVPNNDYLKIYFGNEVTRLDYELYDSNGNCCLNNCIVFPCYTLTNRIAGWVAYNPLVKLQSVQENNFMMNYYSYPSKYTFNKKDYLFILPDVYKKALQDGYLILVDGVFDCVSFCYYGLNAASLLGSYLNINLAFYLKFIGKIFVAIDNDEAGLKMLHAVQRFIPHAKVIRQGYKKDADDILKTELRNKYISQILAGIEQYTDVFFKA